MTLRVLVVDDHPLFRDGLTTAIGLLPEVEVVGEAGNGWDAVDLVEDLEPDIVLLDLYMPVPNGPALHGIDATRQIMAKRPHTTVLILTMAEGDDSVFAAMRAGARGYLLKGADRAELSHALSTVAAGQIVFGSAIASRVQDWFASRSDLTPFPELTDREREVLDLVAAGLTNAAIAARLFVSDKTVRNHVHNILTKLQASGRAEAITRAHNAGLGRDPQP